MKKMSEKTMKKMTGILDERLSKVKGEAGFVDILMVYMKPYKSRTRVELVKVRPHMFDLPNNPAVSNDDLAEVGHATATADVVINLTHGRILKNRYGRTSR
jgi:hypothetical protein